MPKYTLSDRTIYIDGRPMFSFSRYGNDSDGYYMHPVDLDTMTQVIKNLLNASNVPGIWAVTAKYKDGNYSEYSITETDKARDMHYHIEECNGCHETND